MIESHGPVVVRRRLGMVLKRLRDERGLPLDAVARQLEISPSKLSRLETGQVAPRTWDIRNLLEIYSAPPDVRADVLAWADQAKKPGWWQPFPPASPENLDMYVSLEATAQRLKTFSLPVSGLLQTEQYARALLNGAAPHASPAQLDRLVQIRMRRQLVLDKDRPDAPPVELHAVVDEAALLRGRTDAMMSEQRAELIRRSRWPNVTLQVLPFAAGFVMASSTFTIFEPRESADGTMINIEGAGQDAYVDTRGDVERYRVLWDDVLGRALDPGTSRDLIAELG